MSAPARLAALAPFGIRSFRFQWPADVATSWAFEMETLILGWYVLVETRSVFMLTLFASMQYLGTLISPMMGVMGDRVGQRTVLCAMRAVYLTMAVIMMTIAYAGIMTPVLVLCIAAVTGLVRPSDIGMRAALTGDTMPATLLMGAMSIQRTTQDSAKIVGALTGAALVSALGVAPAYTVVACMYATSVLLTLKAGRVRAADGARAAAPRSASPWRDLKEGLAYVWNTPLLLAVMLLAFMLNVTAFPQITGLMPYVAKEVYRADQATLAYLLASFSSGALVGSITLSRHGGALPPARAMVVFATGWYVMLMVFAHTQQLAAGIPVLVLTGFCHSMGQIPMVTVLLRNSDEKYRGRVMGIRMMAIYGNLPGLWIAGPLIAGFGYSFTATLYCVIGLASIALIASRWRAQIWRLTAPANGH